MAPVSAKPSSLRALVRERDVCDEVLSHRPRDGVPSRPGVEELVVVAARRQDLREVAEVAAFLFPVLARPAGLALAVQALHRRGDARQLLAFLRVRGRREREAVLQEPHLAGERFRQRKLVEPHGLLRQLDGRVDRALVGLRREEFGVLGDEVELHPVRAPRLHGELQQALLGVLQERLRFGHGRRPLGGG